MPITSVEIQFITSPAIATALAQYVKRVGHSDIKLLAVDEKELDDMLAGILLLQRALRESGYAPR